MSLEKTTYVSYARKAKPKMRATLKRHLDGLLPLRNPSRQIEKNLVIPYVLEELRKLNRDWIVDKHNNIISLPKPELNVGNDELRGVVAHTDSVLQYGGEDIEEVLFFNNTYRSRRGYRPIGGDDKVGVAIGLSIAKYLPHIALLFPSDEEVGCVGSSQLVLPEGVQFDLAVQNDRKGCNDLVTRISGMEIASKEVEKSATMLLPHREVVSGMMTDMEELAINKITRNGFNLSCGYYNPHSSAEIVVLSHAIQALEDTYTLINYVALGKPAAKAEPFYFSRCGSYDSDYWKDYPLVKSNNNSKTVKYTTKDGKQYETSMSYGSWSCVGCGENVIDDRDILYCDKCTSEREGGLNYAEEVEMECLLCHTPIMADPIDSLTYVCETCQAGYMDQYSTKERRELIAGFLKGDTEDEKDVPTEEIELSCHGCGLTPLRIHYYRGNSSFCAKCFGVEKEKSC